MQELTSDGKSGRYPKSRLFGYLLWWCWVGSKLLGNDVVFRFPDFCQKLLTFGYDASVPGHTRNSLDNDRIIVKKQRQSSIVEPTFAVWPARGPRR